MSFGSNKDKNENWEPVAWNTGADNSDYSGRGGFSRSGGEGSSSDKTCYKCNEVGHMARQCPFEVKSDNLNRGQGFGRERGQRGGTCFKCNEEGHMARQCPSAVQSDNINRGQDFGRERGQRGGACFKCGIDGHLSRDCRNTEDGGRGGRRAFGEKRGCFKCGSEMHTTRECVNAAPGKASGEERIRPPIYVPEDLDSDKLFETGIHTGENFQNYDDLPVKVTGTEPIPEAVGDFHHMGFHEILESNLSKAGYMQPTPIQKYALPIIVEGRDLMACAQTGSGKTAAYLLPVINDILQNKLEGNAPVGCGQPFALVIGPTRELISQIYDEARKFSFGTDVQCVRVYGGAAVNNQLRRLKDCQNPIVMATPGRLLDFVKRGYLSFEHLKYLIFDEADRMLDLGFSDDMLQLIQNPTMPAKGQRLTMMFSATYPEKVQECALDYLHNYLFLVVGSVGAANRDVKQEILHIDNVKKRDTLIKSIVNCKEGEKILVFVERKLQADFIGAFLITQGISATTIHGDRYQEQREEALSAFRTGVNNVLVATSVAARGLDIVGVEMVVNFDLPKTIDEYVHRIGRTGRVGNRGYAISFFNEDEDKPIAKDLVKILDEASQEVPDWLMAIAKTSGHEQTYHGVGRFPMKDIRSKPERWELHGGPSDVPTQDEEEDWAT
ncbi:probable ATP-dependent RNA helicase vasa-like isoform X2 [Procambarus clarkii]